MKWPHMEVDRKIYDLYYDSREKENRNYCDHVEHTMTIRWNGDVVACCYDLTSKLVLGNVNQEDLENIWNNQKYLSLRYSIEKMQFNSLCNNCNIVKPKVYLTLKNSAIS